MYLLVDNRWTETISQGAAQIVYSYASFVLVRGEQPPAGVPESDYEILDDPNITVHGVAVEIPEAQFELEDAPHTLVRFAGPIAPEWRASLESRAVKILFWCPRFGACVRLPETMDGAALREAFPFIVGARPYVQEQCSRDLPEQRASAREKTGMPETVLDIVCFSREDRVEVERQLRERGIAILATSSSKIRVDYGGDQSILRDMVGVKIVDAARGALTLADETMQAALGLATTDGKWQTGFTGKGQIVAVADTGLDRGVNDANLHPDFRGRVRQIASWPINPSWQPFLRQSNASDSAADESSGHGTHVAGLVVGTGGASGGSYRGVAPQAELVFQAIEQYTDIKPEFTSQISPGYYLSGRPLDVRQLYKQARDFGARIHVNAWGDPAQGHYTDDCFETDLFLHENTDAVVLFAAGNDGTDRDGNRVLDQRSLYAPASAKNVVAVGATEGAMSGVGMRGTWGDLDPKQQRYRDQTQRKDAVSGEPERIAFCSSTGPTADNRIKPDICAPGTNLVAPRSAVCRKQGWGLASPMPYYMYNGGTSMSTGVVGGFVALLREAWQQHLGGKAPSGMALKALLVLGARPVMSRAADKEEARMIGGFGRIYFPTSLPAQARTTVKLFDETEPGLMTGDARTYNISLSRPGTLKAVLAWYDAPGEALVNDLDLCLVDSQNQKVWGNHKPGETGQADRANTVEMIHVPELPAGDYKLRVIAMNVPAAPQTFALAVSLPLSPNTEPPAPRLELPVDFVRGVGSLCAQRLNARGITKLNALVELNESQVGEITGLHGALVARFRARLVLLDHIASQEIPALVPRDITLADVCQQSAPSTNIPLDDWRRARLILLPLTLVFKSQLLAQIKLKDLFG